MLMRAGFGSSVIFRILRKWDIEEEAIAGLESAGDEPDRGSE
jgi:hypothetical protein